MLCDIHARIPYVQYISKHSCYQSVLTHTSYLILLLVMLLGRSAPDEFISMVETLASEHHSSITVDCTRAYFFGSRFNVEIEVVMPEHTLLKESHDIALDLQHKLEALADVERAFVHVDYLHRDMPEHKVERNLLLGYTEGAESTLLLERAQSAGSTFPSAA
jgi:Dimerisation domain of Zinc Transporter